MFFTKMVSGYKKSFWITTILKKENLQSKLWPLHINEIFMSTKKLTKQLNDQLDLKQYLNLNQKRQRKY